MIIYCFFFKKDIFKNFDIEIINDDIYTEECDIDPFLSKIGDCDCIIYIASSINDTMNVLSVRNNGPSIGMTKYDDYYNAVFLLCEHKTSIVLFDSIVDNSDMNIMINKKFSTKFNHTPLSMFRLPSNYCKLIEYLLSISKLNVNCSVRSNKDSFIDKYLFRLYIYVRFYFKMKKFNAKNKADAENALKIGINYIYV